MKIYAKVDELRISRLAKFMNQADLAKEANVTIKTISNMETGSPVRPSTAEKICSTLGKKFKDIFEFRQGE